MDDPQPRIDALVKALVGVDHARLERWGAHLSRVLAGGGRLLAAGNGGSAAQAQHLTAELVGRFHGERRALSAIALHAETSSLTAVGNDYGFEEVFARQVQAHGRPGDVLVVLSTSGESANLVAAVGAARRVGMSTWALTGPGPNPLAVACDDRLLVEAAPQLVQECHLVAVHLLCTAVDAHLALRPGPAPSTAAVRLAVVGDLLADESVRGRVHRVCPDAPVAVVQSPRRELSPGGAGLAAWMAARDGHEVALVTAHDEGPVATAVVAQLSAAGVRVVNLGLAGPTPVKTRIRAGGQTLLMLDDAQDAEAVGTLTQPAREVLDEAQAVLVADYGRGMTYSGSVREALTEAARRVPLVWDPHPRGPMAVGGTALVTPNRREAAAFCPAIPEPGLSGDVRRARALLHLWRPDAVVVTRDRDGAVLVHDQDAPALVVPAAAPVDHEASGAGDRLAVSLTVALAHGVEPGQALADAVKAAGDYVTGRHHRAAPEPWTPTGEQDGWQVVDAVRRRGGTVVATGGCFDLVHRGHVALLEQARSLGDCLVVCVNDDAGVARLKGAPRPVVPLADRLAVLQSLRTVDAVLVFAEDTPEQVLARLRPDVWIKGGDYTLQDLPEADTVRAGGGQVVLLPYLSGHSTTALIAAAARGVPAVSA